MTVFPIWILSVEVACTLSTLALGAYMGSSVVLSDDSWLVLLNLRKFVVWWGWNAQSMSACLMNYLHFRQCGIWYELGLDQHLLCFNFTCLDNCWKGSALNRMLLFHVSNCRLYGVQENRSFWDLSRFVNTIWVLNLPLISLVLFPQNLSRVCTFTWMVALSQLCSKSFFFHQMSIHRSVTLFRRFSASLLTTV